MVRAYVCLKISEYPPWGRLTKLIPGFKSLSYEERLQKLKLPTLKYRRLRGDMIEVCKILKWSL